MIIILNHGATRKEIKAIEKKLYTKNVEAGFDAKKYNGIFRSKEDPAITQARLRREWERG